MKAILIILSCILLAACGDGTKQTKKDNGGSDTIQKEKKITELVALVRQYPDSIFLYNVLTDSLKAYGQYQRAASWIDSLINRGVESNLKFEFIKGQIYYDGKLFDSAIATFKKYLHNFPDDEEGLKILASSYAEIGDSTVFPLAQQMIARYPTREMRAGMGYVKGIYFNNKKQYSTARQWLDTSIILNYTFTEAYIEKGYAYYNEGNYTEALKNFTTVTELETNNADAYYWLGKTEEALGNKTEAITYYQQSVIIDPSIKEADEALRRLNLVKK